MKAFIIAMLCLVSAFMALAKTSCGLKSDGQWKSCESACTVDDLGVPKCAGGAETGDIGSLCVVLDAQVSASPIRSCGMGCGPLAGSEDNGCL
ncbi:hypothetical protein BCV69DRAFT_299909 [Microstroma glucosiphilum]|uniref:Extracellular membrane protein CFEM domain-containing protein n=1 Tax=Pseudomicrostroma glucosiphilum TaxID=1684307 RepID=A0A316U4R5_9BASI|nr:hypothetical protein BCV69DRAFT_299909 [Pseudomicrostroma glucosiphilum]PWN20170.1 hypothetical protein BCV69DRAFT_299909 [Pseudomicrostroma glucosiphilum]